MISLLDLGANVVAYRAEGKLEGDDIDRVFAEIDRKLSGTTPIRVYAEVDALSGITPDALWQDVRLALRRWRAVNRIEKAALVTDLHWLRRLAVWDDKAIYGIHLRTFALGEWQAAQDWVRA